MTPTEDDYTDRTTSTKEYKPGTCCVASVKIWKRVVEPWLAAMLLHVLNQGLQIIANVSFLSGIAGVSNQGVQGCRGVRYESVSKFIVFMHYICQNINNVIMPMPNYLNSCPLKLL